MIDDIPWHCLPVKKFLAGPQQGRRIARLQDRPQSQAPFLLFAGANGNFINGFWTSSHTAKEAS